MYSSPYLSVPPAQFLFLIRAIQLLHTSVRQKCPFRCYIKPNLNPHQRPGYTPRARWHPDIYASLLHTLNSLTDLWRHSTSESSNGFAAQGALS